MAKPKIPAAPPGARGYEHDQKMPARPEAGTQAHFKKKLPKATYRYDDSLSPALEWDEHPARAQGEELLARLTASLDTLRARAAAGASRDELVKLANQAEASARSLQSMSRPFLNWTGKAERKAFEVPSLPLFVHERLSTKAILESLKSHSTQKQESLFDLFRDPQRSLADQVLRAYEFQDDWVNRLILGDSLQVMNSLVRYEGLGGQVQMIYMDPPYGVKFGSNFQPFVRKRDVTHNDDDDLTREPEMVQAYRDTWELGLHSYLTYLRDRLLLARELLAPSGSIFVQISDENVHHVREVMDEVFGAENFVSLITFMKTTGSTENYLAGAVDYLLFYARDIERLKFRPQYTEKTLENASEGAYSWLDLPSGERRRMTSDERRDTSSIPSGAKVFRLDNLQSQSIGREKGLGSACWFPVKFHGQEWLPNPRSRWKTNEEGMEKLSIAKRLAATAGGLYYVRYIDDFPVYPIHNAWNDTVIAGFASDKSYVVQTSTKVIQRCMLMTTDPGDLVLDPTCGSGTTAYVAEQWGRRWITCDTSRVPLALARQRLLTATFPWYQLKDDKRGPSGGFTYLRKKNAKGEEVGGIVPHVTLRSIANDEPPAEEVLVDRPEEQRGTTRVTGPFCVEATIPTPAALEENAEAANDDDRSFSERMLEVLRLSPLLRMPGNKTVKFKNLRPPAKALVLSAEALLEDGSPVAFAFGPENGACGERFVSEAAREAYNKNFKQLFVIGFAIQPNAREYIEKCESIQGIKAVYVQATPDLLMGDLLKSMRSSQIFSVCGLPEIEVSKEPKEKIKPAKKGAAAPDLYRVKLLGLDVFDPVSNDSKPTQGKDVPAWFLDTDYNGRCFHVCQAFFPKTGAWDALKRALKGSYEESVWSHLAGTLSEPFALGENAQVAVKVIDERGNELLVVRAVPEKR